MTTTDPTASFDPLGGGAPAKKKTATTADAVTTTKEKNPAATATATAGAATSKKKKKKTMTDTDAAAAAEKKDAAGGGEPAKKAATGYHYFHEMANKGTAPKAQPVKLTEEEANKLAKEMEGSAGGGLSSWNKVRRAAEASQYGTHHTKNIPAPPSTLNHSNTHHPS